MDDITKRWLEVAKDWKPVIEEVAEEIGFTRSEVIQLFILNTKNHQTNEVLRYIERMEYLLDVWEEEMKAKEEDSKS